MFQNGSVVPGVFLSYIGEWSQNFSSKILVLVSSTYVVCTEYLTVYTVVESWGDIKRVHGLTWQSRISSCHSRVSLGNVYFCSATEYISRMVILLSQRRAE